MNSSVRLGAGTMLTLEGRIFFLSIPDFKKTVNRRGNFTNIYKKIKQKFSE
jgi:hypothetical protein